MTDRKHTKDDGKRRPAPPKAAPEESAAEATAAGEEGVAEATAVDTAAVDGELAKLAADCDAYLDHLRRLQAEFDNYRKRVQRDAEQHRLRAAEAVVESLLPVLDNMGRALDAAARHEEGQLIAGLELVAGQLRATLEGDDEELIKAKTDTLMQASHKLAEAVYQQAQQQQSASGEGGESTADENVEDGDFEVIDEEESK